MKSRSHFPSRSSQSGISMVELMVSAVLGLIILAGVFQVYINSRHSQRSNNAIYQLQENGRTALTLMVNTLRLSGFIADPDSEVTTLFPAGSGFSLGASLSATDDDDVANNGIKDETDWFAVRYQGNADDNLVLDCIGNALPAADVAFPDDVYPMIFGVSNQNELFCEPGAEGASDRVTIATGVENLQMLYGVDTDGDEAANYYVKADQVGDYNKVVSIRLSLLIRSDDRIAAAPMAYTYNGVTVSNPDDLRMRLVFSTTVAVRNVNG